MDALARLMRITGCRTQVQLAAFLNVRQAEISDAKRRGIIPRAWLDLLRISKGINPYWIMEGREPIQLPNFSTSTGE